MIRYDNDMKTYEKITQKRKQCNLTQEALAQKLGVSRQAVSRWESGLSYPETDKLIEMAKIFDCSVDWLLREDVTEEKPQTPALQNFLQRLINWEYKSKRTVGGLPLLHIARNAKGIFAIGLTARGVVSVGLLSMGVVSLGLLSIGLLAVGVFACGIVGMGSFALGVLALGAIAIGVYALGAVAIGVFANGACAVGGLVAVGDVAYGKVAVGLTTAQGQYAFQGDQSTLPHAEIDLKIQEVTPAFFAPVGEWCMAIAKIIKNGK